MCTHLHTVFEESDEICEDCGCIIDSSYRLSNADTRRCSFEKADTKHIFKDIKNCHLDADIIETANKLYNTVTDRKIYRGKHRKSIIYACIFQAYKQHNKAQTCEQLLLELKISRKMANEGLQIVNSTLPKDNTLRNTYVTAEDIIRENIQRYSKSDNEIENIINFFQVIKNKPFVNRSKPKSIAAAVIYYYYKPSIKEFSEDFGVSSLTIKSIVRKIEDETTRV